MRTISDNTTYCTKQQTCKALALGAPVAYSNTFTLDQVIEALTDKGYVVIPTAEQMLNWLRSQGFKFIFSDIADYDSKCWVAVYNNGEKVLEGTENDSKELIAIDAALNYLATRTKRVPSIIKQILGAAHECGVCSDWGDKVCEEILEILKRDGVML